MPQIERWDNLPEAVRQHLIERMCDREISISDLNRLRLWIETRPHVTEGDWFKDFGSFKIVAAVRTPRPSCSEDRLQKGSPLTIVFPRRPFGAQT